MYNDLNPRIKRYQKFTISFKWTSYRGDLFIKYSKSLK